MQYVIWMNNFNCYKTTEKVKKCVLTLISSVHFTIFLQFKSYNEKNIIENFISVPG